MSSSLPVLIKTEIRNKTMMLFTTAWGLGFPMSIATFRFKALRSTGALQGGLRVVWGTGRLSSVQPGAVHDQMSNNLLGPMTFRFHVKVWHSRIRYHLHKSGALSLPLEKEWQSILGQYPTLWRIARQNSNIFLTASGVTSRVCRRSP